MFCQECGQPYDKKTEIVKDGADTVVATHSYMYHTNAETYPQLNNHEVVPE